MDANKKCQCKPPTVDQLKVRKRSDKTRIKDWISSAFDSFPKQDKAGSGRVIDRVYRGGKVEGEERNGLRKTED
jgi:hypothetical protein